jgi:hypothetical protein
MKIKATIIFSLLLIVSVLVWAKTSARENFAQAKDFPGGALIYLQATGLPQVIKLWNESKLKEKYLVSENFAEFENSHLGIKLAERWTDLESAIGFSPDLQTLAEKQAAIAIYDIGKLDIVLVAPMNETFFSATMFVQNSNNFTENELDDGTKYYLLEAEFDRQRQKQKIIFANFKGRFILATGEKLFLQTLAAIKGKQRLYDEPNFRKLSERITPNLATVWVNQEKLNADYYFKRYWLMSDVHNLQNIRAGVFDLYLSEKGLTEKREFLLKEPRNSTAISHTEAENLLTLVPENVPFYRLARVDEKTIGKTIYETILDKKIIGTKSRKYSNSWRYYDNNYYGDDYEYLDSDFDEEINQTDDDEAVEEKTFPVEVISEALNPSNPTAILTAASPKMLEKPLFVEFRKIAIISLKNPNAFPANQFENAIVEALKNRVTVADTKFVWETENGLRKLKISMLGWEIGYQIKNDKLFVANSFEFLQECFAAKNKKEIEAREFTDLSVIRLENRQKILDDVMKKLAFENDDFFTGNVGSLLNVIDDVKEIEIKKEAENLYLREEILFKF